MWWALALMSGFYGSLVDDPAEMRFCVVAGEAEAVSADPDEAMMHRLVARKFLLRLADVGAMDAGALDEARSRYESGAENLERYEHCRTLALSIPEGGGLTDAAAQLDGDDAAEPAADADTDAAAAPPAADARAESGDDWFPTFRDLRDTRIAEVRCTMLAGLVMAEVERGVSKESHGLTRADAETLGGQLAAAIGEETGYDAARVRALYKYDFELFAELALAETPKEGEAKAALDAAIGRCRPLYDSIDAAAGTVAGLAPVRIDAADERVGIGDCYAIVSHFARGLPPASREGKAFADMLANLDRQFAAGGDNPAGAKAAALAAFDADLFQDLSEANAEIRMEQCFAMAGGS
ncbi:hypothetical protein [Sphingopyxis sp. PET50]|uniref:hypothetical protein n=1 Tax=Sphingopyxis sp. PET50 TaxID=2976533 RepID=UPI0021AFD8AB|nr:hypothetical protein [Sphingopyxis sp. PET50]